MRCFLLAKQSLNCYNFYELKVAIKTTVPFPSLLVEIFHLKGCNYIMDKIEYLYHYTSLESLALILKNRTIRLNPLDKMDDIQEQKTADIENIGKFVFVSSWTDDVVESIPMWKMYTDPRCGVRIKLRKNPFLKHGTRGSDFEKVLGATLEDEKSRTTVMDTFLDLTAMLEGGYVSPQWWSGDILTKIEYTNDLDKLEPSVGSCENGKNRIDLGLLGKYKNTHWRFQNEWRYIMDFVPMNFSSNPQQIARYFSQTVLQMSTGIAEPPFRYYDLDIDSKYFEEMEITCSPQMSAGNRTILETLVERYNPNATILESELLGKI